MTCGREAACYVVCLNYNCDLLVEGVVLVGHDREYVKSQ